MEVDNNNNNVVDVQPHGQHVADAFRALNKQDEAIKRQKNKILDNVASYVEVVHDNNVTNDTKLSIEDTEEDVSEGSKVGIFLRRHWKKMGLGFVALAALIGVGFASYYINAHHFANGPKNPVGPHNPPNKPPVNPHKPPVNPHKPPVKPPHKPPVNPHKPPVNPGDGNGFGLHNNPNGSGQHWGWGSGPKNG